MPRQRARMIALVSARQARELVPVRIVCSPPIAPIRTRHLCGSGRTPPVVPGDRYPTPLFRAPQGRRFWGFGDRVAETEFPKPEPRTPKISWDADEVEHGLDVLELGLDVLLERLIGEDEHRLAVVALEAGVVARVVDAGGGEEDDHLGLTFGIPARVRAVRLDANADVAQVRVVLQVGDDAIDAAPGRAARGETGNGDAGRVAGDHQCVVSVLDRVLFNGPAGQDFDGEAVARADVNEATLFTLADVRAGGVGGLRLVVFLWLVGGIARDILDRRGAGLGERVDDSVAVGDRGLEIAEDRVLDAYQVVAAVDRAALDVDDERGRPTVRIDRDEDVYPLGTLAVAGIDRAFAGILELRRDAAVLERAAVDVDHGVTAGGRRFGLGDAIDLELGDVVRKRERVDAAGSVLALERPGLVVGQRVAVGRTFVRGALRLLAAGVLLCTGILLGAGVLGSVFLAGGLGGPRLAGTADLPDSEFGEASDRAILEAVPEEGRADRDPALTVDIDLGGADVVAVDRSVDEVALGVDGEGILAAAAVIERVVLAVNDHVLVGVGDAPGSVAQDEEAQVLRLALGAG